MIKFFKLNKIALQIIFLIISLNTNQAKSLEKIYKGKIVSNYFNGVISLNNNDYNKAYNFLKNLKNFEDNHTGYSRVYINTLVNDFKIDEANRYSKDLKKKNLNFFESDLILIVKLIKIKKYDEASNLLKQIKKKDLNTPLQNMLTEIISNWVKVESLQLNINESKKIFTSTNPRFKNIQKIQNIFLDCYFDNSNTIDSFEKTVNDSSTDFSRYAFFYANYLSEKSLIRKANYVVENSLKKSPRNLILNQLKLDLNNNNRKNFKTQFNYKNISHVIGELFYITANALATQSSYSLSNYYINLAIYLNQDFYSYKTLLAENYYMNNNIEKAKIVYEALSKNGEIFNWHSSKQIASIINDTKNNNKAYVLMKKNYNELSEPNLYQTYDYANFLKNNEKYKDAIKYYTEVINLIPEKHKLFPLATDGRGVAYERLGDWDKAEKDLLKSLKSNPNQAYVINYLAYTWIEKGIKVNKSLNMLRQADKLKSNDGYITDSLGWALFKLKNYYEAKKYLQKAVQIMPSDPIVNDHFADSLWMNGNKIQARYYWEYVINLRETDQKLKDIIAKKILSGPNF